MEIEEDVTGLDQDVNFLFDEQIIQDERLFSLEEETDVIDTRLLIIDNDLDSIGNELEGACKVYAFDMGLRTTLHLSRVFNVSRLFLLLILHP